MNILQGEKYLWRLPETDTKLVLDLSAAYNLSVPIAQTLVSRGMTERDVIDSYLFTSFEKDVGNPALMKDAVRAVERILRAIKDNEKILIFGDYDVDGITSSAMMMRCLLPLGANVNFFLPHRVKDGYGISATLVERAAKNGYKVIVTVDNGVTAFESAIKAKECGIDLIITDHHRPHGAVPDAYAVIDPQQDDCGYPYKYMAGVGVTFKVLSLLYSMKNLPMPEKVYELLLLGTVADVVPLTGENRYWVRHGLQLVNSTESLSMNMLKKNSKFTKPQLSSTDIGFSITPQINALGRLQDARQGVRFLLDADPQEVDQVGRVLLELNDARREIERSIVDDVNQQIKCGNIDLSTENIIIAASNNWPPGVIGLVASRIVSAYGKPTILFHLTKAGIAKGSCRSIQEFNMFNALSECKDLLTSFGGHSLAAGLALDQKNLPELKARLEKMIAEQLTPFDLKQKLQLDAQAAMSDLNSKFMSDMVNLEPFGNENRQPTFYIPQVVQVQQPRLLKDAHIKCSIFADGVIKPIMFFNRPELFEKLCAQGEEPFDVAATVAENHWNGRVNVELMGTDIAGLGEPT